MRAIHGTAANPRVPAEPSLLPRAREKAKQTMMGEDAKKECAPPQVASPGSVLGRFLTGSRRRRVVRLFSSLQVIILLVTRHPLPTECREPCGLARGCMRHPINRESMAQNHSDQVRGLEIC